MKYQETNLKKNRRQPLSFSVWLGRNVILAFLAFLLILFCYRKIPGYTWVKEGLLEGNMQVIRQYKNLPLDQRYEMKLGFTYAYLRFLKNQTPPDAVILMPGKYSVYFPKNEKSEFTGEPFNKLWVSRFLYPRKIVYDTESGSKYREQVTHVAIVNGWGYDLLPYEVPKKAKNTVLPMVMNDQK